MSGLELVGFVASLVQLITTGIKVADAIRIVYHRYRHGSVGAESHLCNIQHVVATATIIKESRILHTELVYRHVRAILAHTEELQRVLVAVSNAYQRSPFHHYWTALRGGEERIIKTIFCNLEREKTSLILLITSSSTNILDQIHTAIEHIHSCSHTTMPPDNAAPTRMKGWVSFSA